MNIFSLKLVLLVIAITNTEEYHHDISKRSFYLLFPRNTVFQFTYGLTVPYILPRRSINLTWGFQAQYNLPTNISNFAPMTIAVRSNNPFNFDLSKIKFYEYLSKMLDDFGLSGEQCVLRSVCEIADIPMYEHEDSILEKILQFLFTPSLLEPSSTDQQNDTLSGKLINAEKLGKTKGQCEEIYSKCFISIIDLMTILYVT